MRAKCSHSPEVIPCVEQLMPIQSKTKEDQCMEAKVRIRNVEVLYEWWESIPSGGSEGQLPGLSHSCDHLGQLCGPGDQGSSSRGLLGVSGGSSDGKGVEELEEQGSGWKESFRRSAALVVVSTGWDSGVAEVQCRVGQWN